MTVVGSFDVKFRIEVNAGGDVVHLDLLQNPGDIFGIDTKFAISPGGLLGGTDVA